MILTSEPRKRNKYNEIMERIQVTPDMHERIMSRIRTMDIQPATPAKPTVWTRYRKYMVTAASLIVVLAGVLTAQHGFAPGNESVRTGTAVPEATGIGPQSDMMAPSRADSTLRSTTITGSTPYDSLAALTKAAGFAVKQVTVLPFTAQQTKYALLDGVAEIRYIGSSNQLTLRMASGGGDISGDYTDYSSKRTVNQNGLSVTIKGSDKGYKLATWEQNGYTYCISMEQPISSEQLLAAVSSVK